MEVIGSCSNTHQNDSSGRSQDAGMKNLTGTEAFVNHAEISWSQMRTEWVGDQSKKLQRPKGPTICLTESYEDVFLSNQRFHPPMPLAKMVCYLGKIWQEGYELGDSLTESYADMLLSNKRFQPPIPLATMVHYFGKIWQEGYGLGDG